MVGCGVCESVMWARGCVVIEYGSLSVVDEGAEGGGDIS